MSMPSGSTPSIDSQDEATLTLCRQLLIQPSNIETVGAIARKRGLPLNLLKELTAESDQPAIRPALLRGFMKAKPTVPNEVRSGTPGRRLRLIPAAEMMARPDPKFLIEGLVEDESFAVLYGDSGTGKTFLVLDWCFSIAAGLSWLGRAVEAGPTVYVGAEGAGGLPKRLRSLVGHHQAGGAPPDFYLVDQPVNLLDLSSVGEAVAAIEDLGVRPRLVVFDTYARSIVGGDENSAKDAGQAISALDDLRFTLGTAVLVVHHTGKKGTDERGSGALRGAADTMLKVSGDTTSLQLIVDKQKNFEAGPPVLLRLDRVGESLVPVARTTSTGWDHGGEGTSSDKEQAIRQKLLDALSAATENGETSMPQTALVKEAGGNRERTSEVLKEMAEDPLSPVVMEERGNKKLYSLQPSSDSIPPTP